MKQLRKLLGTVRAGVISAWSPRRMELRDWQPTVSFTFDDFPRSALRVGGSILADAGARGTYYAAMGLMNQTNHMGEQFGPEDLRDLLIDGHELGSHTLNHASGRSLSPHDFEVEVKRGREAVEQVTGVQSEHQFSYPYGHVTLRSKSRIGERASTCRGIYPGVNESPVDLNLLRANRLYSWCLDMDEIGQLLESSKKCRGWVIFYTHDIAERPSEFGCTPREFEGVVQLARKQGARILPVGQAVAGLAHGLLNKTEAQSLR